MCGIIMIFVICLLSVCGIVVLFIIIKRTHDIAGFLRNALKGRLAQFFSKHIWFFILLCVVSIFYVVFMFPHLKNNPPLSPDVFRDIAYAQNILNGNSVFDDPAIKGEYIWYPPLNGIMMAFISALTGVDLFSLYNCSLIFINMFSVFLFSFKHTDEKAGFFLDTPHSIDAMA